jgi:hypothetical protein
MCSENAERHALIADYRASENIFEATVGEILLRQTDHLDGYALGFQVRLLTHQLVSAIERFEQDFDVIGRVYEAKPVSK